MKPIGCVKPVPPLLCDPNGVRPRPAAGVKRTGEGPSIGPVAGENRCGAIFGENSLPEDSGSRIPKCARSGVRPELSFFPFFPLEVAFDWLGPFTSPSHSIGVPMGGPISVPDLGGLPDFFPPNMCMYKYIYIYIYTYIIYMCVCVCE